MTGQTTAVKSDGEEFADELKPGTELMHGQYTIEGFLAAGGFGITYLARDSLKRPVVIKECFPGSFCRRQEGQVSPRSRAHQNELKSIVRLFSQEASSLAKANHPNIVGVHQIFEENNTAYMALDFVRGRDLLEILQEDPDSLSPHLIESYLTKVLDAIKHIHNLGMLHRDISPDNIIINEHGEPILIDFGAARESTNERVTRMLSALRVVKDGYSPQEFYIAGSEQSPSCDLYSLAASFYHIITRELPPDSQWRLSARAAGDNDPYESLSTKTDAYPDHFVASLDKAMSVLPRDRIQSADEWLGYLNQTEKVVATPTNEAPAAKKPAAAEKKSSAPLLLGASALAIAAGAAYFFVSSTGTDIAPQDTSVDSVVAGTGAPAPNVAESEDVAGVAGVVDPPADPILPVEEDVSTDTVVASIGPTNDDPAIAGSSALGSSATSEDVNLPPVEIGAVEFPAVQTPTIDATQAEILVTRSFAPNGSQAPLPRPASSIEISPEVLAVALPTVDVVAPEAPAESIQEDVVPTEVEATPPAANDNASTMLDFFISMQGEGGGASNGGGFAAQPTPTPAPNAAPSPTPVTESAAPAVTENVTLDASGNPVIISRVVPAIPFTLSDSRPGVIVDVAPNGPAWLSEGQRVLSINGEPVSTNDDINAMIDEIAAGTNANSFEFTIGLDGGVNGAAFDGTLSARKENQTLLLNGLRFATRQSGTRWTTQVIGAPEDSGFRVGDTLVSFITTFEEVDAQDSLTRILERELGNGNSVFNFAVNRDGRVSIEVFTLAALGGTE